MTRFFLCLWTATLALCLLACSGEVGHSGGGSTGRDAAKPPSTPEPCVTLAKYNTIKTGMSRSDVSELLGCRGEENARTELAGTTTVIVTWKNFDGANMNATFQNDALVGKAQFGLR